ncbi:MAG: xylulokinase [Candidatus Lernaella stagnicola]|nr:xylulokinase [Candidatus Lernaella stagnicola]
MAFLLGIDVGTSGAKALIMDENGAVQSVHTEHYPLSTPEPLWSEQDPEHWWEATCACCRAVLAQSEVAPADIRAVGLTGQMHGLVLLDKNDEVLRPAILWNDQRTESQCRDMIARFGVDDLLDLTANPVLPGFTAPKILWVREQEPEIYERIKHFLLPKDYLRFRLTGEFATEVSDASGTSLFDVQAREWSETLFHALDIPLAWAPVCAESTLLTGQVSREAAAATGLAPGTVVVGGAGDQAAQALGSGLSQEGLVSATLGTSGVVFAPTSDPLIDNEGRLHAFCHANPGMWHVMGVMLSAGGSLRWFRDALGDEEMRAEVIGGKSGYDRLAEEAAGIEIGSEGLYFLPYLIGERTPHPDPHARACFIGLTLRHGRAHMARAVFEGVTFGMRDSLELIRDLGIEPAQIRVSGGGAKSAFWRQMLADVFSTEIAQVNVTEGAAFGAALLAGVGAGIYSDVDSACDLIVRVVDTLSPDLERAARYEDHYERFGKLYPALQSHFRKRY